MIQLNNISKRFGNKVLFENLSYTFPDTGLFILNGKNGTGKTTLLNIIYGFESTDSGEVYINDILVDKKNENYLRQNEIGYIFQNSNLNENLTVYENLKVAYILKYNDLSNFDLKLSEVLKKLNILKIKRREVKKISGGEKERVNVARALLLDYKIILADEPTASLDKWNCESLYEIFKSLSKDKLIIMVSHDDRISNKDNDSFNITLCDLKEEKKDIYPKEIKKNRIRHQYFSYFKYFKGFRHLSFLMILILILSVSSTLISFTTKCKDQYGISNYIVSNNIRSVDVSESFEEYTDDTYNGYDLVYTNNNIMNTYGERTFYILDTEDHEFYYEKDIPSDSNLFLEKIFTGFFRNVLIDNSLSDSHIKVSSLFYDFFNYEHRIKNNMIQNQAVTLVIDDVIEQDYKYYDLNMLSNYNYNSHTKEEEYYYNDLHNYNMKVIMNENTYNFMSKKVQGFGSISESSENYYKAGMTLNYKNYGSNCAVTNVSLFKNFIIGTSYDNHELSKSSIAISDDIAEILNVNKGDYIEMRYSAPLEGFRYTKEVLVEDVFETVTTYNYVTNPSHTCILSDDLWNDYFDFLIKYDNEYSYETMERIDITNENFQNLLDKAISNNLYLQFVDYKNVYSDMQKVNEFVKNLDLSFPIMTTITIILVLMYLFIEYFSRKKCFLYYRSIGYSENMICNYTIIYNVIVSVFTLSFGLLSSILVKNKLLSDLLLKTNYNPGINNQKVSIFFILSIVVVILLSLLFKLIYPKKIYNKLSSGE